MVSLFKGEYYVAIGNYEPLYDSEIALTEGTIVQVVDGKPSQRYWVVEVINQDGSSRAEGLVPSTHLQKKDTQTLKRGFSIKDDEEKVNESLKHRE